MSDTIPSVDLADFLSGTKEEKNRFVQTLGDAFHRFGFVAVKNHGVPGQAVSDLYRAFEVFFALPEAIKSEYEIEGMAGQRGYTGKGKEHAKGRNTGDLKEFYHIGQELDELTRTIYPENIWPAEVPQMEELGKEVYRKLEWAGFRLLEAVALYLDLPENYFDENVKGGNSILRPIHYYPIENPDLVPPDAVRAAEHEDINLITLLLGASAEGLEILNNNGQWLPVTALPDHIVVNVGDMLARLTNDQLKSTTHRVVNPPKDKMAFSRYSMPFFLHPRPDMDLSCLNSRVSVSTPKSYSDMTAGEYLEERLKELGLRK